jgi:hypothetical protein
MQPVGQRLPLITRLTITRDEPKCNDRDGDKQDSLKNTGPFAHGRSIAAKENEAMKILEKGDAQDFYSGIFW